MSTFKATDLAVTAGLALIEKALAPRNVQATLTLSITLPGNARLPHFQETLVHAVEAHGGTLDKAEWKFQQPQRALIEDKRHNQSTGDST